MNIPRWRVRRESLGDVSLKTKIKESGAQVRRFASIATLLFVIPLGYTPQDAIENVMANSDYQYNGSVSFSSPSLFSDNRTTSAIQPGESRIQIEARQKAEAEARAKAEEEANIRAKEQARLVAARESATRSYRTDVNFDELYQRAGNAYGVDPRLLKAVHYVETGGSGSTTKTSYAGATGPMQFLPSTWKRNGVDGNGDGVADIHDVEDAMFAAARYLKVCGYPDVRKALWGYNPSSSYYNKVMGVAHSLGM